MTRRLPVDRKCSAHDHLALQIARITMRVRVRLIDGTVVIFGVQSDATVAQLLTKVEGRTPNVQLMLDGGELDEGTALQDLELTKDDVIDTQPRSGSLPALPPPASQGEPRRGGEGGETEHSVLHA